MKNLDITTVTFHASSIEAKPTMIESDQLLLSLFTTSELGAALICAFSKLHEQVNFMKLQQPQVLYNENTYQEFYKLLCTLLDSFKKSLQALSDACCYGTALIFHFFSLFGLVDIIIRFKGEHMVNTCCSTAHGFLMFNCAWLRTSWLPHVEYSRTTYIRIPRNASCITHVFHSVYIVYQIAYQFFSCILLRSPL